MNNNLTSLGGVPVPVPISDGLEPRRDLAGFEERVEQWRGHAPDGALHLPGFEKWLRPLEQCIDGATGKPASRILGQVEIAGLPFWVDCVRVLWTADAADDMRIVHAPPQEDGFTIAGFDTDACDILDSAYHAFGLDGEVNTVQLAGRWYAVFIYPASK